MLMAVLMHKFCMKSYKEYISFHYSLTILCNLKYIDYIKFRFHNLNNCLDILLYKYFYRGNNHLCSLYICLVGLMKYMSSSFLNMIHIFLQLKNYLDSKKDTLIYLKYHMSNMMKNILNIYRFQDKNHLNIEDKYLDYFLNK